MSERKPLANAHGLRSSRFFRPALEALRDLGGRAASEDIYDWIAKRYAVPQDELTEKIGIGITRFENYVRWSCSELVKGGLVANEGRNLWSLTKKGRETKLSDEDAARLYRKLRLPRKAATKPTKGKIMPRFKGTERPTGAKYVQYFQPVLQALRDLGSSAKPKEVYDWMIENKIVHGNEITKRLKNSGQLVFKNRVRWAVFYLTKAKLLSRKDRGVWVLTEKGRKINLSSDDAYDIMKEIDANRRRPDKTVKEKDSTPPIETEDADSPNEQNFFNQDQIQKELATLLRKMTPPGFERFCAHLLRHIGFEDVKVSPPTRDGGIDGEAFLPINRFVRTKVMFQCKRYQGTVGSDKVQQFRGALTPSTERGIFLTTGTFTKDAKSEAMKESLTPIELVDIDDLLRLMIEEKLGIEEVQALRIKSEIFDPYMSEE